jgi:hypothetical protein
MLQENLSTVIWMKVKRTKWLLRKAAWARRIARTER